MTIRLKSPEEIEILREGGKRHAEILRALCAMVKPGLSTQALEKEARRLIKEKGDKAAFLGYTPSGAERPFPAALCVSINEEIVHGIPNEKERIIQEGDIVSLDLGLWYRGLITDAAVSVCAGTCSDEDREMLKICEKALNAGVSKAKAGNTIGDIGFAISEVVNQTKFSLIENLAGHGVGYQVHEEPFVPNEGEKGEGKKLVPGMVIAIEPMISAGSGKFKTLKDGYTYATIDGSRSAHFEHTVAITEKGNIILTL